MKHLLHGLHTVHVNFDCNECNRLPSSQFFAAIKVSEIEEFLKDFVSCSKIFLNFLAFYMQVPYKRVPNMKTCITLQQTEKMPYYEDDYLQLRNACN